MVKTDEMFKLTLITSCGIQSRARLTLYIYAWRMRQHVNMPLSVELREKTVLMNGSYALLGNSLLGTVHHSCKISTLLQNALQIQIFE